MVGPSFGPTKFSCWAVYWIHSYAKVAKKCIYSTLQSYKNNVKNSPRHHSELEGTDSSTCMDGEYYDRWTLIFQIYDASLQSTTFQLSDQLILKVTSPGCLLGSNKYWKKQQPCQSKLPLFLN